MEDKDYYWLRNIRAELFSFLSDLRDMEEPGYFRYSYSGDLFPHNRRSNLAGSIFALKLYYMLGEERQEYITPVIQRVLSFQKKDGTIFDPFVYKKSFSRNFISNISRWKWQNLDNHYYIRAETRQAYSALLLYNVLPEVIMTDIPTTPTGVERFFRTLDWTRPWGAGSHFSHLMFFLALLKRSGRLSSEAYQGAAHTALDQIAALQNHHDGSWYKGSPSLQQKINGAMKVITGLLWADVPFAYPERLIDLCLVRNESTHACDQFNKTLVLRYANKATGGSYRRKDIETWCYQTLNEWQEYFHSDKGGFSFWRGKANERYYGARITRGRNEPDIHGTVLFVWGLGMMSRLTPLPAIQAFKEMRS